MGGALHGLLAVMVGFGRLIFILLFGRRFGASIPGRALAALSGAMVGFAVSVAMSYAYGAVPIADILFVPFMGGAGAYVGWLLWNLNEEIKEPCDKG